MANPLENPANSNQPSQPINEADLYGYPPDIWAGLNYEQRLAAGTVSFVAKVSTLRLEVVEEKLAEVRERIASRLF